MRWEKTIRRINNLGGAKSDDQKGPKQVDKIKASEQAVTSIAGHVSRHMMEHYSHFQLAKRAGLDSIATPLLETAVGNVPAFEADVHQIDNHIGLPQNGVVRKLLN